MRASVLAPGIEPGSWPPEVVHQWKLSARIDPLISEEGPPAFAIHCREVRGGWLYEDIVLLGLFFRPRVRFSICSIRIMGAYSPKSMVLIQDGNKGHRKRLRANMFFES